MRQRLTRKHLKHACLDIGIYCLSTSLPDLCLPFRLGTSPFFFHRTANAFEWLLKNYPFHDLKHYPDDHFMVSPSIFSVCAHNAQTITHLASQVGIPLAPNIDLPIQRSTDPAIYRSIDLRIHRSIDAAIYRSRDLPIQRSTDPEI